MILLSQAPNAHYPALPSGLKGHAHQLQTRASAGVGPCLVPDSPGAHVDQVGDIVDVVFADSCIAGRQIQQVVIPGLCALQLVFRILCLPLEEEQNGGES